MSRKAAATAKPTTRPPNDRGQGRKALEEGSETVFVGTRMTADQKAKLQRLGGAAWIRERIDKARE